MTPVIGLANAIDYRCALRSHLRGENMKDQTRKSDDRGETQKLEQVPDSASEDETKRLRTLSVQELEQLLKDKKP